MVIYDEALKFAENQDVSANLPAVAGANIIDIEAGTQNGILEFGSGHDVYFTVVVTQAFVVAAGSPVLQIHCTADVVNDAFFGTGGGGSVPIVVARIGGTQAVPGGNAPALAAGQLTLGAVFQQRLERITTEQGSASGYTDGKPDWLRRYLGATFVQPASGANSFSAGSVTAFLTTQQMQYRVNDAGAITVQGIYPANYEVR